MPVCQARCATAAVDEQQAQRGDDNPNTDPALLAADSKRFVLCKGPAITSIHDEYSGSLRIGWAGSQSGHRRIHDSLKGAARVWLRRTIERRSTVRGGEGDIATSFPSLSRRISGIGRTS